MASDRGSGWAFPIERPIRSSESSPVPLPSVKTPKMDALTALQTDFTPNLPTECLSAHGPPQSDIPLAVDFQWNSSVFPSDPVSTVFTRLLTSWSCSLCHVLTNHDAITGCELGLKHMRSVSHVWGHPFNPSKWKQTQRERDHLTRNPRAAGAFSLRISDYKHVS